MPPMENAVLMGLYHGKQAKVIAREEHCSASHVYSTIYRLMSRYDVHSRTRLVTLALESGLIELQKGPK